MNDKSLDKDATKAIAWLAQKMRCPLCGFHYNLDGIKVVPRNSKSNKDILVHTDCGRCECPLLFALDVRGGEIYLIGVVTDLTYADALKFQTMSPFSTDEVIDFHNWLEDFDGDFVKAFRA